MSWIRTTIWAVAIFGIGFIVGLLLDGPASKVGIFLSSTILYFMFLRPVKSARFMHAIVAFIMVEIIDCSIVLSLGAPLGYLLESWDSPVRHSIAVLLAYVAARLSSNNSFKPKPLRGSA